MNRLPCRRPPVPGRRSRQRGAVAIVVGLTIVVLMGFVGLALDGGHLYLTKTELQNSADACALAASYELTGAPDIPADAFSRAEAAGKTVGGKNKVDFQASAIASSDIAVCFGTALNAGIGACPSIGWVSAGAASPSSKYVRCTVTRGGISPWFMQVLGFGDQTVSSLATASLEPSQSNCALPMALCTQGAAPNYGYSPGQWVPMDFQQNGNGNSVNNYTGNFRWIDFDPSAPTPGCSGGGANELACLLAGVGQCSLPEPTNAACSSSGNANPTPGCVGQTGSINSLDKAFNTRFGVYANGGGYSPATAPPDFTGNAYSTENWTSGNNAYAGVVAGQTNFKDARAAHLQITNPVAVTPPFYSNNDTIATQVQYAANGADRRLVVVPIVDCSSFVGTQHAPVRAYACVLMLDPYRRQGNDVKSRLEYLGRSDIPGSPCATSGIAGDASSLGPMVPALVQ
ncbi:pilus assembly protein TadG-related protein [Rhodoferax ferrireducens]|uniref:pilus assembly protein TadG-related protein n=1 Tax=Rhodoferax ferrireducens TaxID=192843 RepID=UPI003BB742D5